MHLVNAATGVMMTSASYEVIGHYYGTLPSAATVKSSWDS